MTLDQLRYFLETAKVQHLGKAAQALHISPSAVSTAIAALEDEYQCELFEREGKRIRLSEKGKFLRLHAEKLFDQTTAIRLGLQGEKVEFGGTYKIAASHYLATHLLGQIWPKIQKKYANLSAELGSMPTYKVVADILSGELDAGLCISPLRHPDLKNFEIYEGQMQIVVRNGHPILKSPKHLQLKMISQFPALLHKPVAGIDLCQDHPMFDKFGINPDVRCYWDSDDVAVQILKESDSWTLLPDFVLHNEKKLTAISCPPGWSAPLSIMFVVRLHRSDSPLVQMILNEIKSNFAKVRFR